MKKSHIVFFLVLISGFAVLLRCLHLLNPDHYYIISPDSHFFHWQAEMVLSGQSIPLSMHSGLTYPLAYSASFIGFVSGLAPDDALTLAGKLIPPMLAVVSIAMVYWVTSRLYDARVGLCSAAAWAVLGYTVFTQLSGYLDRDGLSMVLLTSGVFLFYWGSRWRFSVAGRDMGWALGAAATAAVCVLLYLEWLWLGPALLLIIVAAFVIAEALVDSLIRLSETGPMARDAAGYTRVLLTCAAASVRKSSWRPLVLLLVLVLVVAIASIGPSSLYQSVIAKVPSIISETTGVAELGRLTADDILRVGFLIVPLVVGFYIAITRHRRADLLLMAWAASMTCLGLFVVRIFLYAAPALCVVGGLGLRSIFSFSNVSRATVYIRTDFGVLAMPSLRSFRILGAVLLVVLLVFSTTNAAYLRGLPRAVAANENWKAAMAYLKENTPPDSVVMSWWDYGYWILDMGGRSAVVNNGSWDEPRLQDVGLLYCTDDPSGAVHVMQKYGAAYVIFSREDVAILPVITRYGMGEPYGDGSSVPEELEQSLFYRSLYGNLHEEGGITRVYPPHSSEAPEVVILALS